MSVDSTEMSKLRRMESSTILELLRREWDLVATSVESLEDTHRSVWKVITYDKQYFLKRYLFQFNVNSVQWEQTLINQLKNNGFPLALPEPVPSARGTLCLEHQSNVWALMDVVPGRPLTPDDLNPDCARQIGKVLAQYHRAAAKVNLPQRPGSVSMLRMDVLRIPGSDVNAFAKAIERVQPANSVEALLLSNGQIMLQECQYLQQNLSSIFDAGWMLLPIHGDFSPWNLMIDNDGQITGIIDFEYSLLDYRIADLARVADVDAVMVNEQPPYAREWIRVLIEGYQTLLSLEPDEILTLPDWMRLYYIVGYLFVLSQWLLRGPHWETLKGHLKVYADLLPRYTAFKQSAPRLRALLSELQKS